MKHHPSDLHFKNISGFHVGKNLGAMKVRWETRQAPVYVQAKMSTGYEESGHTQQRG